MAYLKHQKEDRIRRQNKIIMKEHFFKELYEETDRILPGLELCLAAKKDAAKKGASALRR